VDPGLSSEDFISDEDFEKMMASGAFEKKKPAHLGGMSPPYQFDESSLSPPSVAYQQYGGTPNSLHPVSTTGYVEGGSAYQPPQGPPPQAQAYYQPPPGPPPHPFAHIPDMAAAHDENTNPALYHEAAQKIHEHHEQHKPHQEQQHKPHGQQHHVPSEEEQYESQLQAHAQAYG
jgi:hypothetical protein